MFDVWDDNMEPVAPVGLFGTEGEAIAYTLDELPHDAFVYLVGESGEGEMDVTAMVFIGLVWRAEVGGGNDD